MSFANYQIAFNSPWYLLLLAGLPALWWFSRKSIAGLGRVRGWFALALRSLVLLLLVLAAAEMQFRQIRDSITVIYLLDQSESIPAEQRRAMLVYARQAVADHRVDERGDKAAVIAFGQNPAVEIGPIEDELPLGPKIESFVDGEFSDLESAMNMAKALFPEDGAKRIIIISDGNENVGDARRQARQLAASGVGIDVLPIYLGSRSEVAVEKVALPSDVRRGQPFQLRVVLNNYNDPAADGSADVSGRLRIVRKAGEEEITLVESPVTLPPGKTVIAPDVPETIERPDFYTYEARFIPDEPTSDAQLKSNTATSFTQVRGKGQVLLIVDWANPEELPFYQEFAKRLGEQEQGLQVTIKPSNQLFDNLADLQRYDSIVLANVPRTSGGDANELTHFSDDQIDMLVRNTQQLGAGLVMLGGPNSFGAGGWTGSELEKAMPVDFEIKNLKVETVGALALIMHAGEMPEGNFWQKVIAKEAIKALGGQNYAGMLHWDGQDRWLWTAGDGSGMVRVSGNKDRMLAQVDRMTPGDMPQFDPTMRMAAAGMAKLQDVAVKHMIIISDGDPSPPSNATMRLLTNQDPPVQVTTVAVGSHGFLGHKVLKDIASDTGGKYYVVSNPRTLPKIYQQEARKLSRPLVFEADAPFAVNIYTPHEILQGIPRELPPIKGYVMTEAKDSPLVEVVLRASQPVGKGSGSNTIMAAWTYGLGRTVAFTTDVGVRWATAWDDWDDYGKFFSQMIRWSMRPIDDTGQFLVSSDVKDGEVQVVVTAWDENDEPQNLLNLSGTVVGPGEDSPGLKMEQTAPGRYVGTFPADDSGSYFVMLNPGAGRAPIRTGVNVPYSAEYRDRETNMSLLRYLASLKPTDGEPGKLIGLNTPATDETEGDDATPEQPETDVPAEAASESLEAGAPVRIAEAMADNRQAARLLSTDIYRETLAKPTVASQIWPWLLFLAAGVFFFDVFLRRVQVSFAWLPPLLASMRDDLMGREKPVVADTRMDRLRSRKQEVTGDIDRRRASTRFEPSPDAPVDDAITKREETPAASRASKQSTSMAPEAVQEDGDSYTSRLKKAKEEATRKKK